MYAKNIISRRTGDVRQEIDLLILVQNISYHKDIEVRWAAEDRSWKRERAFHFFQLSPELELWRARIVAIASHGRSLPGSIRFALRYKVGGKEYWDNNHSSDYSIEADSGVIVGGNIPLLNVGFCRRLERGQRLYPVSVAVHRSLRPKQMHVVWTTDNWKTYGRTPCLYYMDHWLRSSGSRAPNPNKYGWEIRSGQIRMDDAYRLEYAVCCDTASGELWDNNFGRNYLARRDSLKIVTLNLHCCQEERQDEKFSVIAKAISDLRADIVCLQEVGENWNGGAGDWQSNAARIIRDRLKRSHNLHYNLYTDWSHIGFDRYREGVAILSRFKILDRDAGYVSRSRSFRDIHARKVVMVQVHVPYMGLVNVFSVHLSWWEDGFREQFDKLSNWANRRHTSDVAATLLCGDFNAKAGAEGYSRIVETGEYEDQFLKSSSKDVFNRVFGDNARDVLGNLLANDHRIDFVFMKKESKLKVVSARALFTQHDYGRVSDHEGYFVEFEPSY